MACSTEEREAVMSIFCPECGLELPERLKFCVSCGQKLAAAPSAAPVVVPPTPAPAAETEVTPPEAEQPAAGDAPYVAFQEPEPVIRIAGFCSACGQALSPGMVFCPNCGRRADGAIGVPAENGRQKPVLPYQEERENEHTYADSVEAILLRYGTKRMLLRKLPFVLIMLAIALVVIPILGAEDGIEVVNMLSGFVLAFMMWRIYRQPSKYTAKKKKALAKSGCSPVEIKKILAENPIFGRKAPIEAGKANRLANFGVSVGLIGMLLWLYGLFAFLLPVISCILVPHDFNLLLFGKGLRIFSAGLLLSYVQKIVKGMTKT